MSYFLKCGIDGVPNNMGVFPNELREIRIACCVFRFEDLRNTQHDTYLK